MSVNVPDPSKAAGPNEPRCNARKHNYAGQHVATNPQEEIEFTELFDGFARLSHIEEASKAKLRIRRIERDLPKAIAETGYDSQKVILMHRYLKEHRSQLRYALNVLDEQFQSAGSKAERGFPGPLRWLGGN